MIVNTDVRIKVFDYTGREGGPVYWAVIDELKRLGVVE